MSSLDIVAENFEAFENDIFDCKPTRTPLLPIALSAINAELGFVVHGKPDSLTLSLHQHLIWNYFWHRTAVNTYHTISVFPIISALTSLSPRSTWSTAANRCCSNTALSGRRSIAAAVTAE